MRCVYQQVYRPMVRIVRRYHAVRGEISVDNHKVRLVWSSRGPLSPVYVPHVVQPKENVPYRWYAEERGRKEYEASPLMMRGRRGC